MSDQMPEEILIITSLSPSSDTSYDAAQEVRRGFATSYLLNTESIDITKLQKQINIFIQQMNQVMSNTPEKVGNFRLEEFEVSAEIKVEASGEIKLALLGGGEISGGIGAGLKFVFKRS